MRDGEVVAADLVSAAIRRLWREMRLRSTVVRVGVASQRVVVRTIDMPAMTEADLESALQFQVQEYIPIPVDDAILDFQLLEEFTGADDEALVRVLVAAAHHDVVNGVLAAVEGAGLRASAVDLVPFALIRSLAPPAADEPATEAIVSIGAGVTTVVVHDGGLPRFVRIVASGGNMLTDAISQELGVPTETAEAIKRHQTQAVEEPSAADLIARGDRVLQARQLTLVGEVRGSLDFFAAQAGATPVTRVLLTGGGALSPGIAESLEPLIGVPVEMARPRDQLDVGDIGFPPDEIPNLDPYLPVPVGLALGGARAAGRRISLLPKGRGAGLAFRRALTGAGIAVAAVLFILILVTLARAKQVSDARHDRERQDKVNAAIQKRINDLQNDQAVEQQVAAARTQVQAVLAGDTSWSRLLDDIARTIPNDVWLTGFQAQAPTGGAAPGAAGGGTAPPAAAAVSAGGSATFTAVGLDFVSVAAWLQRMSQIPAFANLWVPQLTKNTGAARPVINFSSTVDLTARARSNRLQRILQGNP
jgi:type IV pilus assembly protein PilM